ncbi:hypothetical protein KSP39_PZI014171 [Platanthera zijinensis]|uniref:Uncharacterized protein n=1 Tax=Platanthera zijinensis TaxID=2320716 RepID=A0AAP0BDU4_9ASPA
MTLIYPHHDVRMIGDRFQAAHQYDYLPEQAPANKHGKRACLLPDNSKNINFVISWKGRPSLPLPITVPNRLLLDLVHTYLVGDLIRLSASVTRSSTIFSKLGSISSLDGCCRLALEMTPPSLALGMAFWSRQSSSAIVVWASRNFDKVETFTGTLSLAALPSCNLAKPRPVGLSTILPCQFARCSALSPLDFSCGFCGRTRVQSSNPSCWL